MKYLALTLLAICTLLAGCDSDRSIPVFDVHLFSPIPHEDTLKIGEPVRIQATLVYDNLIAEYSAGIFPRISNDTLVGFKKRPDRKIDAVHIDTTLVVPPHHPPDTYSLDFRVSDAEGNEAGIGFHFVFQ